MDTSPRLSNLMLAMFVAADVLVLDIASKAWAVSRLTGNPLNVIDGFLRFAVTHNPGASFSSFQNSGPVIAIVGIGVTVFVVKTVDKVDHRREVVGLGFILGGAMGNLVDRIFRGDGLLDGAVVDFIDFSFFPTFNLADTSLTIGVVLMLLSGLLARRSAKTSVS
ncbi:MAG: signal peptidase II [Acidobacteria bacterium]|nr:signal peptidase II [Acidobacteriota bacterium]